jgi:hypothetical protein
VKFLRGALIACLMALCGWILLAIFAPTEPAAAPQEFTSSNQCRDCHAQVFDEWQSSWHAQAWDDPDVRALSDNFSNTDCIDCHAPRPVFETGIGKRVLPRSSRRSEGVDCIACHALAGGGVAGTIQNPRVACAPVTQVELQRPEFCGVCHDQHKTVQEWKASSYPSQGVGCIDCHMPYRGGDPQAGRDHTCRGGHDMELVRSAVELRARREGHEWVIEIENVGAGHSFPTDERSRAADLFWRPLAGTASAASTSEPWRRAHRIRSPYRYEVGVVDNLLLAHEVREIRLAGEGAGGAIELALFYKLTPYYKDPEHPDPETEAHLIQRLELVP